MYNYIPSESCDLHDKRNKVFRYSSFSSEGGTDSGFYSTLLSIYTGS